MQGITIEKDKLKIRTEETLDFLQLAGGLQRKKRTVIIEETITPFKESVTALKIKSKAMEDEFLREVIPTKKEQGVVDKLWGSCRKVFKKREEIFEDGPFE